MTDFDVFWAAYPRPMNKFTARTAWDEALQHTTPEVILEALERAKRFWARGDAKFIPYPATWLNAGGWEDELEPTKVSGDDGPITGFYAKDGSMEMYKWDQHWLATRGTHAPRDKRFGWRFPTRWPPS